MSHRRRRLWQAKQLEGDNVEKGRHCDHGDVAAKSPYAVTAALVAAANDDEAPPLREEPVARLP